jgi:formate dehydrogenase
MAGKKSRGGAYAALSLRPAPKGRAVEQRAFDEVVELLGSEPRTRDLLIEHLHKLQDRYGCLTSAHMTALAYEMRLTPAEVFEVATFYHHFDIVKDGDVAPPKLTIRVCESIACHLAGGEAMIDELQARLGAEVRVVAAPCIGRCDAAPAAIVGQNSIGNATTDSLVQAVEAQRVEASVGSSHRLRHVQTTGWIPALSACVSGQRNVD